MTIRYTFNSIQFSLLIWPCPEWDSFFGSACISACDWCYRPDAVSGGRLWRWNCRCDCSRAERVEWPVAWAVQSHRRTSWIVRSVCLTHVAFNPVRPCAFLFSANFRTRNFPPAVLFSVECWGRGGGIFVRFFGLCVERERDFYSHKAGNQKGHAHQTWCLLFSNMSMI